MPIRTFLNDAGAYAPDDLQVMGDAFSAALNKLGLHDREDVMVEMVAQRIVNAAFGGERDQIKLTEIGVGGCW